MGADYPRQEANELLDAFPMGIILLSSTGRVLAANRPAERILDHHDGLSVQEHQLRAADPEHTAELHDLVRSIAANGATDPPDGANAGCLPRPSGRRPLQILVRRLGHDVAAGGKRGAPVALFVTDPDERVEIPIPRLRRIYGLTHSEARIASRIAEGLRPESVAAEVGVQVNTVRMHLKRIFAKTGTRRQSELVRLLLSSPARLATDEPLLD
jgi:DNA-binding CsgD family transcriptional regulator